MHRCLAGSRLESLTTITFKTRELEEGTQLLQTCFSCIKALARELVDGTTRAAGLHPFASCVHHCRQNRSKVRNIRLTPIALCSDSNKITCS